MSEVLAKLQLCVDQGQLRAVDLHLAKLAAEIEGTPEQLLLLTALVSFKLAQGDICLPLEQLQQPQGFWPDELLTLIRAYDWSASLPQQAGVLSQAQERTQEHGQEQAPVLALLVFDFERVYLYRYWQYECAVADELIARATPLPVNEAQLQAGLEELFPIQIL